MKYLHKIFKNDSRPIVAYILLAVVVFSFTIIGYAPARSFFNKFLFGFSPFVAIPISVFLGFCCLIILHLRDWFQIFTPNDPKRVFPILGLSAFLPLVAVIVDLTAHFPKEMNQSFPGSLAFYPSIAFVVEVVFHLIPITILCFLFNLVIPNSKKAMVTWSALFLVAFFEPTFQIVNMKASSSYSSLVLITIFINLLVFNFAQLLLFKRSGFLTMYASRLVYYLIWHVLWGYFRLGIIYR